MESAPVGMDHARWLAANDHVFRAWLDEPRIVALCLARPANAVVAATAKRPLNAGVVRRWSVVTGYRRHPSRGLDALLEAVRAGAATNLVVCGVDHDDRVIVGPVWIAAEAINDRGRCDACRAL